MSSLRPIRRRRLLSSVAPLLLAACSAPPGSDDSSDIPEFGGTLPGAGTPAAPAAPAAVTPGATSPGAAVQSPAAAAPAPSNPGTPAANEGAPAGPVGLEPTDTSNTGAGGSGATNDGMNPPAGAAGTGMAPAPSPAPAPTPAPAPAPAPTLPPPPGAAFFFDDFEAGAPGTQPAAWDSWINYSNVAGNSADNPQFALLDDTQSVSGAQSIHFHTEGATQPAMLTLPLPAGLSSIYIRAFVMSRIAVGGVAADAVSNHETLIGLRATTNDGNDEIRFGGAKGALGFNAVGPGRNDAVAPLANLWGSAPGMQPGQWHCVEIAFVNQGTPRATATLNGTVVRDVTSPQGWHIPVSNQWLDGLYKEVMIGWQSFSVAPANDVWMDDVVLSEQPIGCD